MLIKEVKHYGDAYMNINIPYFLPILSPKYIYFKQPFFS